MKTASVIARYLAGAIFLVMGLNGFLNFIPFPPPPGVAGQFMGALYVSHYLWVIFAFQVIAGVLLLVNRYVPLAVAMLAPVIVNIITFHALMACHPGDENRSIARHSRKLLKSWRKSDTRFCPQALSALCLTA